MRRDPLAALSWMRTQPNADDWLAQAARATHTVPPENAPDVARWFAENSAGTTAGHGDAFASVVRPWIENDAAGAVGWATSLPEGPLRTEAVKSAAVALAQSNDPEAAAWVESLVQTSPELLAAVVRDIKPQGTSPSRLGPLVVEALPELVRLAPENAVLHQAMAWHLSGMVREPHSRDHTLDAIARLPDPADQQQLLSMLAGTTKAIHPQTSRLALRLANSMPDPEAARRLAEDAVTRRLR